MKTCLRNLALAIAVVGMIASQASAAVIVADDFDSYADGALGAPANNGGTGGWTGAWTLAPVQPGDGNVLSSGVLQTTDNSVSLDGGQFDSRLFSTSFDGATDGPLYFSARFSLNKSTAGGYAQWVEIATTGGANGTGALQFGYANGKISLRPNTGNSSFDFGTAPHDGTEVLLVGKVDFNASGADESVTLWVDPTGPEGLGATDSVTHVRDLTWTTPSFITVGNFVLNAADSGTIDDIRLGTTWADVGPVPEPASIALLAFGFVGLVARRRRS